MADLNISFVPYAPGTTGSQGQRIASIDPRLSRTNYFDGRLLKATDLIRDQVYLDERALEIGQALGSGIVRGLDVELLDNYRLRVAPGMAIAPSGRVLQLAGQTLEVNLGNSALITHLNQGYYRRFKRGLYLVALQYAEVGSDSAEAYPADLASQRRFNFNSFAEGVELTLVPLGVPLSHTTEVAARAGLVAEFMQHSGQRPELSDEAVALGLLALEQARPLWLDKGLVRRPLRQPGAPDALQRDLATHYDELLDAVLATRNSGGLTAGFAASQYFNLLPPWGRLPKAAVDPVNGSQTYFPAGYEVSIAPVRRDDLPAILAESSRLAPMHLQLDLDADIMVLVPLSNSEFAWRARGLEHGLNAPKDAFGLGRLLAIDRMALRLRPPARAHEVETDKDAWTAIWQLAADGEILFVRRPPRTAETNVSAVVLARGFDLPKPTLDLSAYNRVMEKELAESRAQLSAARQDLRINRDDFARRLRNLKLDPEAPAKELAEKVQSLEKERDVLVAKVKELEAGGSTGGATDAELENARQENKQLNEKLATANKLIGELQLSGTDTASTELRAMQRENARLQGKLADAEKEIGERQSAETKANTKLATAAAQIAQLTQEVETGKAQITVLQATGANATNELATAKANNAQLTQELNATRKTLADLQSSAKQPAGVSMAELAKNRPPTDAASFKALEKLQSSLKGREQDNAVVADILMLLDRRYDALIWPTLAIMAEEPERLIKLRDTLQESTDAQRPAGAVIAKTGIKLGLSEELAVQWRELG